MTKVTKAFSIAAVCVVLVGISYQVVVKVFNVPERIMKKMYPKKYSEYVEEYAKEYEVDDLLVYAVIKAESNFDNSVVSKSDAKGLMQLMDSTAVEIAGNITSEQLFEPDMLFDAETNIKIGVKYLSELLEKYNRKLLLSSSRIQCRHRDSG